MDQLIEAIRAALATGANDETKVAGASACRAVLAALEAKEGEPLAPAASTVTSAAPDVGALITGLKGVPLDQLLDLAIVRLKAALPSGTNVPPVQMLKLPLLPLPARKPGGRS